MSPRRPVTANRLPRLRTSFSVPVDSGSWVRSPYPSSSSAGTVVSVRSPMSPLPRARRGELLGRFAVEREVVVGHAIGLPALAGELADAPPVEERLGDPRRRHQLDGIVGDDSRHPILDHLRNATLPERQDRYPAEKGFDHDQAERLVPLDGKEERAGPRHEPQLARSADGSDLQRPMALVEGQPPLAVVVVVVGLAGEDDREPARAATSMARWVPFSGE